MSSGWLFVLFCIADVPVEAVNRILQAPDIDQVGGYRLWLASENWRSSDPDPTEGTVPPIESVPRAYIGKSVPDVAKVLADLPEDSDFDRKFFAVLDETTITDGDLMVCHVFAEDIADDPEGDWPVGEIIRAEGEIEGLRCSAETSVTRLASLTIDHPDWGEVAENNQDTLTKWPAATS